MLVLGLLGLLKIRGRGIKEVLKLWSRNLACIGLDIKCSLQYNYIFGGVTCFFIDFSSHSIVLYQPILR